MDRNKTRYRGEGLGISGTAIMPEIQLKLED
jgi:hypothetical protein